jgi:uncharacterized protein YigE (DUF2233 family)
VNVPAPGLAGVEIDAELEEPFSALDGTGLSYLPYIDYAQGRTLIHTVTIDPSKSRVDFHVSPSSGFDTGLQAMNANQSLVTINGGYYVPKTSSAEGYFFDRHFFSSEPMAGVPSVVPMLGIKGITNQRFTVIDTPPDFTQTQTSGWSRDADGHPIWDTDRDGTSDFDMAVQCEPWIVKNGVAIPALGDRTKHWARTTVGVGNGKLFLVVADGEGIRGAQGADFDSLARFYIDVLGATSAMSFDGGLSTMMVIRGANGPRYVNTLTWEDSFPHHPPSGRVLNFLSAW